MSERFCWLYCLVAFYAFSTQFPSQANALPASTTAAPTTHIVSFVKQRKSKAKHDELRDFDSNANANLSTPPQLSRLVQHLDMNLTGNSLSNDVEPQINDTKKTDDSLDTQQNTLENTNDIFGVNEQHESAMTMMSNVTKQNETVWQRMKQSIHTLEPVKHLLNTVRDGAFNRTEHVAKHHHQLVNSHHMMMDGTMPHHNESSAIETEEEREMANDGPDLMLLETLGRFGGMIWEFVSKIFAASAASFSGSSSGGG